MTHERAPGLHVTDILQACGFRSRPDTDDEKMAFYLERGRFIHKATEFFDRGTLNWKTLHPKLVPYVEAYRAFREQVARTVFASEQAVASAKYGYVGRLDRVFADVAGVKGLVLMDIKTTQADAATRLQTSGYRLPWRAANRNRKVRRGFVALRKDGTFKHGIYEADTDDADEVYWLSCVRFVRSGMEINAWRSRNKLAPIVWNVAEVEAVETKKG